jgi:hypothetical protein
MMELETIRGRLADSADLLKVHGVVAVYVFGSVVRGTATPDSDVDLLVEFSCPIGLVAFVALQQELANRLGVRVDLVTRDALKPQLQARILSEAVRAA